MPAFRPPIELMAPREVVGAAFPTAIILLAAEALEDQLVRLSLVERLCAPHRDLDRELLSMVLPRVLLERVARKLVSLLDDLAFLMDRGSAIRLRKTGSFRSRWVVDLMQSDARLLTWAVEQIEESAIDGISRELQKGRHSMMSGNGAPARLGPWRLDAELRRKQVLNAVIREHDDLPMDELLDLLEDRRLLDPIHVD